MKKLSLPLLLILTIAAIGCSSLFKTTKATTVTIDQAMKAWADYVHAGLANPNQIGQVKAAYEKYYNLTQAGKTAAMTYKATGDTNELYRVSVAIATAEPELINLILSFLPLERSSKLKGLL